MIDISKDFKDSDVVIIEVSPYTDNYVVPNHESDPDNPRKTGSPSVLGKAAQGPFKIETTGRSVRDLLLDVEPEPDLWESHVRRHEKAVDRQRTRLLNDSAYSSMAPAEQEAEILDGLYIWGLQHSAARLFFEGEGRGRLPIKSIKLIENRGPRHNDHKSRVEDDREFMELIKQKLKRDLVKEMAAESAAEKKTKAVK